jgi:hypothetical protein
MTTRISIKSDLKPLKGYSSLLKNVKQANTDILNLSVQKHINRYLRPMELMNPGPSLHGGGERAWSTDPAANRRAQRWFFANYPNGFRRTGALNRAWRLTARGLRLSLENASRAASYVFSFAKNVRARGGRPNPGHIRTGHPQLAQQTARQVLDMILDDHRLAWSKSVAASVAAGIYRIVVP